MSFGDDAGICGWLKNSFIDYPGTVSTVLFFRGCNLRCPYCHNPDLVYGRLPAVSADEVVSWLEKRAGLVEGVVLSGGEPSLHQNTLSALIDRLRGLGMKIKLDTNGLIPAAIRMVAPDYCAMDLKTLPENYGELGWPRKDSPAPLLEESLSIVRSMGENAEVRITVAAPFINNGVIDRFTEILEGFSTVYLQPLELRQPVLEPKSAPDMVVSSEKTEAFRKKLAKVVGRCEIRGR
jgi:pyruvate formate lyase activating enzyme